MHRTLLLMKLAARSVGLDIRIIPSSRYDFLLLKRRHSIRTIRLFGRPFQIVDCRSFAPSYREIFKDEIYHFQSSSASPLVVDCGANCGASVLYFKKTYPQARVVAVEADPAIYQVLRHNVEQQGLQDVITLNKAVTSSALAVKFYQRGADAGSLVDCGDNCTCVEVEPVSLDALLSERVDFMKIDIEGEEVDAICSCTKLRQAEKLFIEYHSFSKRRQELQRLLDTLSLNGFRYYIYTISAPCRPFIEEECKRDMDMQLNICCCRYDQ